MEKVKSGINKFIVKINNECEKFSVKGTPISIMDILAKYNLTCRDFLELLNVDSNLIGMINKDFMKKLLSDINTRIFLTPSNDTRDSIHFEIISKSSKNAFESYPNGYKTYESNKQEDEYYVYEDDKICVTRLIDGFMESIAFEITSMAKRELEESVKGMTSELQPLEIITVDAVMNGDKHFNFTIPSIFLSKDKRIIISYLTNFLFDEAIAYLRDYEENHKTLMV